LYFELLRKFIESFEKVQGSVNLPKNLGGKKEKTNEQPKEKPKEPIKEVTNG
jgi:hypothetical protein